MDLKPTIIFEDEHLLVLDKPAGMVMHEGVRVDTPTLVDFVSQHLGDSPLKGERWGLLHRLDRFTSGLVLVAKTRLAFDHLKAQFKARAVTKEYLVLVHGQITPPSGRIEIPLARSLTNRIAYEASTTGRKAVTEYKTLETFSDSTYLAAYPKTGRTHQIRVHLALLGHPVFGDATYGKVEDPLNRYFLHAHKLTFTDWDNEKREFVSPLPSELKEFLEKKR